MNHSAPFSSFPGKFVQQGKVLRVIDHSPRPPQYATFKPGSRLGKQNNPHNARKRFRMTTLIGALAWPMNTLLLTFGYDGSRDPKVLPPNLRAYLARLQRRHPGCWGLWRLEFKSGPHYHLVVAGIDDHAAFADEGTRWWAAIAGSHGCPHHVQHREVPNPDAIANYIAACSPEDHHPVYGHLKSWGKFGTKRYAWHTRLEALIPTIEGLRTAKKRISSHHRYKYPSDQLLNGLSLARTYDNQDDITQIIVEANGVDNRREVPLLSTTMPAAGYVRAKKKKKKKCPPAAPCAAGDRPDMLEAEKTV